MSYCVHNVTTAVLPSTSSMETLSSGHFMYTIGHTYFPKSLDNQLNKCNNVSICANDTIIIMTVKNYHFSL